MKNLKMSTKLLAGFSVVIMLTVIVGAVGIVQLRTIDDSYSQSYINTALPLPVLANATVDIMTIGVSIRDAIIFIDDPDDLQEAIENAEKAMASFKTHAEQYQEMNSNPNSQASFNIALDVYQKKYMPAVQQVINLTQTGDQAGAMAVSKQAKIARAIIWDNLDACLQYDSADGAKNSEKNTALSNKVVSILIGVIVIAVVISILLTLYLSNIISNPLVFMKNVLLRIGTEGDLKFSDEEYNQMEQYAVYNDEVGQSVGMLLTTVRRLSDVDQALGKVSCGNLNNELTSLSDKDTMGISLQKMTNNLNEMFHELEQQAEALKEARDIALQNSRYKSDFLSRMSHEIRTPMNAIIGMTNIAKASDEIERKDYCLEKIDSASTHLLGVINDVLDMSKIEAGKLEVSFTEFSLERMLIKITNVVSFRMEEKGQSFSIMIDNNVPQSIVSDEQRLSQVVTNLLSNANKFTPEHGSISLFIRNLDEQEGSCMLEFEVRDTGIGIPVEQRSRLFQPFEQENSATSRKFGGTGLGLAISKHIVEMLGGSIHIESALERGSSFIFTIRAEIGKTILPVTRTFDINWDNLRMLAVDDEDSVREFFIHMAKSYNIQCEVVPGGNEALELIEKHEPFNIIFADWKMPEMDGVSLSKKIKALYGDNTVIIMISAAEWTTIETEARQAGIDGFISKPLFGSVIIDCINEYLGPRQQAIAAGGNAADNGCFKGKRILLAEDIEINREIIISLLKHTGIQIDCAEDGVAAYRMFMEAPNYDLILMDIHMPEVDGYEATEMIRGINEPRAKTVPIIAMTASVFKEDVERCLASGMNGHIGKPLDFQEVMKNLKQFLNDSEPLPLA